MGALSAKCSRDGRPIAKGEKEGGAGGGEGKGKPNSRLQQQAGSFGRTHGPGVY